MSTAAVIIGVDDSRRDEAIKKLLMQAKALGVKYYQLTGKPLGVTGEIAELEAAEKLGLMLVNARTPAYDAIKVIDGASIKFQIKGRAIAPDKRYVGRVSKLVDGEFDGVLLVLLDRQSLDAIEIWQATRQDCMSRLDSPGSRARNERRSMAISQFKSIGKRVWP